MAWYYPRLLATDCVATVKPFSKEGLDESLIIKNKIIELL